MPRELSVIEEIHSTPGNVESPLGKVESPLGKVESPLGKVESPLGKAESSVGKAPARALYGNVLVKALQREIIRPSGLIVPFERDERPQEGEVLSVGGGIPWDLRPGDIVMFGKYYCDSIRPGQLISILRRHILGVLGDSRDWHTVVPFNRIIVEMIPVVEDYKRFLGIKSDLVLMDKKFHFEPTCRRGIIRALDETQSNGGEIQVGDVILMPGHAGFTLDGDDSEDQPLHGTRHRWIKFKDVAALDELETEMRRSHG